MHFSISLVLVASVVTGGQSGNREQPVTSLPAKTQLVRGPDKLSPAEMVAELQRDIEADRKALTDLKTRLEDPASDYVKSQTLFREQDEKLKSIREAMKKAEAKDDGEELERLKNLLPDLQKQHKLAEDRFNLAIEEHKTLQQKVAAMQEKLVQDKKSLDQLTGKTPAPKPKAVPITVPVEGKSPPPQTPVTPNQPPENKTTEPAKTEPPPTTIHKTNVPILSDLVKKKEEDEQKLLHQAKQVVEKKEQAQKKAQEKVSSIDIRMDTLRKNIQLEEKLLQTARHKLDNIHKTIEVLQAERQKKWDKTANNEIWRQDGLKIQEEYQQAERIRSEVRTITNRLTGMQADLNELQSKRFEALQEVNRKSQETEQARQKMDELQNPYTAQNIWQWFVGYGPPIGIVLVVMIVLLQMVRLFSKRTVSVLVRSSKRKHREREAEQRVETLGGVLRNFASLVIWFGGILMILDLVRIPVIPLMGGAAVFGLAVAFGAQNMIRDYFTGFMILIEDQYGVKDIIRIGGTAGQVERISLRMTVLRDLEGNLHFIPHGTISHVTNLSHSWARALMEIGVAYKENVDQVIRVLKEVGRELRADPEFGPMVIEDLEMLGVEAFGDSSVNIKFYMKTKPQKQWAVRREMLRRIKNRFDAEGIEIPFPHRTVFHHHMPSGPEPEGQRELSQRAA